MTGKRPDHIDSLKICGDDVNICRRLSVPSFQYIACLLLLSSVFLGGVLYLVSLQWVGKWCDLDFTSFFCDINIHLIAVMVFSNGQMIWLRCCKKSYNICCSFLL